MGITGFANLAVKVADMDAACAFYKGAGAVVRDRMVWGGGERADVLLGPLVITLFTRAISSCRSHQRANDPRSANTNPISGKIQRVGFSACRMREF